MHEMSNNFLIMKNQTFIDKIQTENVTVKNPNSLDKIQHYGNTAVCYVGTIGYCASAEQGLSGVQGGILAPTLLKDVHSYNSGRTKNFVPPFITTLAKIAEGNAGERQKVSPTLHIEK